MLNILEITTLSMIIVFGILIFSIIGIVVLYCYFESRK